MPHLGAAKLPVLAAIVAGSMASSFALLDYRVFENSSSKALSLAFAVVMVLFTTYHLALVTDSALPSTNVLFGGIVETLIALVALAVLARSRLGRGVR